MRSAAYQVRAAVSSVSMETRSNTEVVLQLCAGKQHITPVVSDHKRVIFSLSVSLYLCIPGSVACFRLLSHFNVRNGRFMFESRHRLPND